MMGDFFFCLNSAAIKHNFVENHSDSIIHGAWMFTMFKLIQFEEKMRASNDELHMTILN